MLLSFQCSLKDVYKPEVCDNNVQYVFSSSLMFGDIFILTCDFHEAIRKFPCPF